MRLRGELGRQVDTDLGAMALLIGYEQLTYGKYHFADGQSFHVDLKQQSDGAGPLQVNSHLGYRLQRGGDDLTLAGTTLALRRTVESFVAGGGLKLDLGNATSMALAVEDRYDDVGKALFVADLPATKVSPDVNKASVSLGLARDAGALHYGVTLETQDVRLFQQSPLQNAVPFTSYALRAHIIEDDFGGWQITGSFGLRRLDDGVGIYDRTRPVYKLIAERRFAGRYSLKGSLVADFDADDTDDPLATYRRQLEVEAGARLMPNLLLQIGGFGSLGDNLLLENRERRWGTFGQLTLKTGPKVTLLMRIEYTRKHSTIVDVDDSILEGKLAMQAAL